MTRSVMIVEDELFVALDLQDIVEEIGHRVLGPYVTVREALDAIEADLPACAILDVQLLDGEVYPAADRLRAARVPIIFHSGHADETQLLGRYPDAAVCAKPSSPAHLQSVIERLLNEENGATSI
ncbi:response regulator [Aureimonas sp. AU20]|uniref:response regulator n=1 Tax=Aureimonas sp. AU20 TaxID=1349819 RepID=UPI000783F19F|nr:response regulator [Aureimonas sp. AU20]